MLITNSSNNEERTEYEYLNSQHYKWLRLPRQAVCYVAHVSWKELLQQLGFLVYFEVSLFGFVTIVLGISLYFSISWARVWSLEPGIEVVNTVSHCKICRVDHDPLNCQSKRPYYRLNYIIQQFYYHHDCKQKFAMDMEERDTKNSSHSCYTDERTRYKVRH